ncbi:MAG: acetoin utilization protein AcuC [Rhodospirillaceae bacterium]|nr:acetoin utilization protein AcuC [Rhodospirillaceae bacterium]MCA8933913.1 acetoin utilization protein AcuC [Rhodospirillaceae bacterium]
MDIPLRGAAAGAERQTGLAQPLFIGNEIYRASRYGVQHPLSIPRVSTAMDLARAMGWLPAGQYRESVAALPCQLTQFHAPDYVAALIEAEAKQDLEPERRARFNLGGLDNPIFPEIFSRPATASGACLMAAGLLRGGGIVYSPAGGTHHGRPDRASGFCYLNDPVLAILALLRQGLSRVFYVDVDAHHGDGVQDAFADDDRVFTVSVHEGARWPRTGPVEDRAGGQARNLPVPAGLNDSEMDLIRSQALVPLACSFRPQAIVVQCGADALDDDPLSRLALSNGALWRVVAAMMGLAPRLLVLGGGGYNPWSVGRCWAGVWATLNGIDPAVPATPDAQAVLRGLTWQRARGRNPPEHWFSTIADPPRPGPVRDEICRVIDVVMQP